MLSPKPKPDASLRRTVALVGLMGVGKSSVGRRLAGALGVGFRDADAEIEAAAGLTVAEIFALRGEAEFRAGERRVIARLLEEPPHILATGGGAFAETDTRALLKRAAWVIWLKADLQVLARRVARKNTRPLLIGRNPLEVLEGQMRARYPAYAEAHAVVEAGDGPHGATVDALLATIAELQAGAAGPA